VFGAQKHPIQRASVTVSQEVKRLGLEARLRPGYTSTQPTHHQVLTGIPLPLTVTTVHTECIGKFSGTLG